MSIFLDPDDVAILTGKKSKSGQVAALRGMGIAFFVNPTGRPIVTKAALEGRIDTSNPQKSWQPAILNHG
jgi:hypothetical protein